MTHAIQVRTDYFLTRTDGESIPDSDAAMLDAAPELLEALEKVADD